MEQLFKNYYAIVDRRGEFIISSIRFQRKNCIKDWVSESTISWEDCQRKYGWSCVKVNVMIKSTIFNFKSNEKIKKRN